VVAPPGVLATQDLERGLLGTACLTSAAPLG